MNACVCCRRDGKTVLPMNCPCRPGTCRKCIRCPTHCRCKSGSRPPRGFHRLPKAGDKVAVLPEGARPEYPAGAVGMVVGLLDGSCGPIVAVRFPGLPNATVDLFWRKVGPVTR